MRTVKIGNQKMADSCLGQNLSHTNLRADLPATSKI